MQLVAPKDMPKLGKGGSLRSRQALLHSLVHTESWAIDLSWVNRTLCSPLSPSKQNSSLHCCYHFPLLLLLLFQCSAQILHCCDDGFLFVSWYIFHLCRISLLVLERLSPCHESFLMTL